MPYLRKKAKNNLEAMEKQWVLYILECGDGSFYTGITNDLQHRLHKHMTGKGAKYTRGRGPLMLRYLENCCNYSDALRREMRVKKLSHKEKLRLCQCYSQEVQGGDVFSNNRLD